jgi:hypothetical protein
MRRYRASEPGRLRDLLLTEMAGILERHASGLAADDADAIADVRQAVDAMLLAAERDPHGFACWKRRAARKRNAAEERAGA